MNPQEQENRANDSRQAVAGYLHDYGDLANRPHYRFECSGALPWTTPFSMVAWLIPNHRSADPRPTKGTRGYSPIFHRKLWIRFFLLAAPFWVILIQFFVGLLQSPVETLLIEKTLFRRLEPIYHFLPTSMEPQSSWLPLLSFGSMYLFCSTLFIIPKSLAYFERVLPWLCLNFHSRRHLRIYAKNRGRFIAFLCAGSFQHRLFFHLCL